jgi:hypothetical protein
LQRLDRMTDINCTTRHLSIHDRRSAGRVRRTALERTTIMEFLLFLCAALSALTGAITGARAPERDVQIERVSSRVNSVVPVVLRAVSAIVQAQRAPAVTFLRNSIVPRRYLFSTGNSARGERRRE